MLEIGSLMTYQLCETTRGGIHLKGRRGMVPFQLQRWGKGFWIQFSGLLWVSPWQIVTCHHGLVSVLELPIHVPALVFFRQFQVGCRRALSNATTIFSRTSSLLHTEIEGVAPMVLVASVETCLQAVVAIFLCAAC